MAPSRILVTYYSRSGTTRAVATALRAELSCDIEPIVDRTPRLGLRGYVRSTYDALFGRPADIGSLNVDPRDYDVVILGTPVWDATMSTPVRTFLSRYARHLPRVAFFCTHQGTGSARALRMMGELCGKEPLLTLDIRMAEVKGRAIAGKVRTFAAALEEATKAVSLRPESAPSSELSFAAE